MNLYIFLNIFLVKLCHTTQLIFIITPLILLLLGTIGKTHVKNLVFFLCPVIYNKSRRIIILKVIQKHLVYFCSLYLHQIRYSRIFFSQTISEYSHYSGAVQFITNIKSNLKSIFLPKFSPSGVYPGLFLGGGE